MKDKKLEERLERLEELSNKVMAPYIENVSLAQQREKIKEELEEMETTSNNCFNLTPSVLVKQMLSG